jgi:hypothetical protein
MEYLSHAISASRFEAAQWGIFWYKDVAGMFLLYWM